MEQERKYPEPICQDCGKTCYVTEEVDIGGGNEKGYSHIELWCYCKECNRETNHPIPSDNEYYPE
jgi:hypothetical protein